MTVQDYQDKLQELHKLAELYQVSLLSLKAF
jgi:hypothetical protein